jgi:hypothetical protein
MSIDFERQAVEQANKEYTDAMHTVNQALGDYIAKQDSLKNKINAFYLKRAGRIRDPRKAIESHN